jgi:hypothetical protein
MSGLLPVEQDMILLFVLYGCEKYSLSLGEEHKLQP